ncbi:hypothetical protein BJ508DRAFT_164861 [Ascobolus immersus RN42]|uniref:Transmembrane protein n=1 Tax=Ascobolus immersus RN42 TaxID=1160509 RepID=A0A3N4HV60_ASCIM|nr:hypothetical protein BJ508DRAFT_164861 [Ascobolus immersus RN42]
MYLTLSWVDRLGFHFFFSFHHFLLLPNFVFAFVLNLWCFSSRLVQVLGRLLLSLLIHRFPLLPLLGFSLRLQHIYSLCSLLLIVFIWLVHLAWSVFVRLIFCFLFVSILALVGGGDFVNSLHALCCGYGRRPCVGRARPGGL